MGGGFGLIEGLLVGLRGLPHSDTLLGARFRAYKGMWGYPALSSASVLRCFINYSKSKVCINCWKYSQS